MLRVGVDLIDNVRIARAIERHGEQFYNRFLTLAERAYCGDRIERIAARIAAKEAVAKALGTGIGDVSWRDIEILADDRGRPILVLYGAGARLAEALGIIDWDISLSHTAAQSIAFVVGQTG
jgi:holo-[acyl-carrier protein] synthase